MRAIAHSSSKPPGRFGFISPTYTQSKDVAWEYLKSYSRPFLSETPNESELRVDLWNGSRIRLYGADNPDSLRGLGFDGLVIDEYADVSPSLYPAVLRPALADRKGRCTFIGTVKGRNHLWKTYEEHRGDPDWYVALLPASKTGLLTDEELAAAKKDTGDAHYGDQGSGDDRGNVSSRGGLSDRERERVRYRCPVLSVRAAVGALKSRQSTPRCEK